MTNRWMDKQQKITNNRDKDGRWLIGRQMNMGI